MLKSVNSDKHYVLALSCYRLGSDV